MAMQNVFLAKKLASVKENSKRKAFARRLLVIYGTRDLDESHNR